MPGFNYLGSRATADRLITRFGRDLTFKVSATTGPDYDPAVTTTSYVLTGAVVDYTDQEINGTSVLAGDKRILLKATGITFVLDNSVTIDIDGILHNIVAVSPLSPGGVVVLYDLQIRRP